MPTNKSTNKHSKYFRPALVVGALVILAGVVYAASTLPLLTGINGNGFRLPSTSTGVSYDIVSPYGTVCGKNNGSGDIFVPANSSDQWNAAIANPPAGVTYTPGACAAVCTDPSIVPAPAGLTASSESPGQLTVFFTAGAAPNACHPSYTYQFQYQITSTPGPCTPPPPPLNIGSAASTWDDIPGSGAPGTGQGWSGTVWKDCVVETRGRAYHAGNYSPWVNGNQIRIQP